MDMQVSFQEYTGISTQRCAEIIATASRGEYLGELLTAKNMTSDEYSIASQYFRYRAKGNMTFNSMIHAVSREEMA